MSITRLFFKTLPICLLLPALASFGQTQMVSTPYASPKAKVVQEIGLTYVTVTFYRPAVNDRDIWTSLAPDGQIWRAGANDNTVISFSEPVFIEGQELSAGKYGLHIIPSKEKATLIFSHNTSSWGSFSYKPEEDALRVDIPIKKLDRSVERLNFEFYDLTEQAGTCALIWEKRAFPFRIETPTKEIVVATFRDELRNKAGWSWKGWHEAAQWCLQQETNLEEALGWANRSVSMDPNPQNLLTKANLKGKWEGGTKEEQAIQALASLKQDLTELPVGWKEYNAAADLAFKHGKFDLATEWSEKSADDRANMPAFIMHAKLLHQDGQDKEAERMYERALEVGTNAELNAYGYQLLFSGKKEEAIQVFIANTEKHPEDPNVWDSLGEGYFNLGDYDNAIPALKKSLSMDPPSNVKANSIKLLSQMGVPMESSKSSH